MFRTLSLSAAALLVTGAAHAATISVPNDIATIQGAINAASAGDEIVVDPGTYGGGILLNKAVTLRSANPSSPDLVGATVLDAAGSFHAIRIDAVGATVSGFTIQNGAANGAFPDNEGGGILVFGDDTTIRNCVFLGNTADFGGAIAVRDVQALIDRCTFVSNMATSNGGAISNDGFGNGQMSVRHCSFISNHANEGGAIETRVPTELESCSFTANVSVSGDGAGIFAHFSADVLASRCSFIANNGTGLHHGSSSPVGARLCQFCNNVGGSISGNPISDFGGNAFGTCGGEQLEWNDDCATPEDIALGATPFNTLGATSTTDPLPASCDEGNDLFLGSDLWYRYVPNADGVLTVSMCGAADYDGRMAAYEGDCGALTLVACNDDACGLRPEMSVMVTKDVPVLLRVGGFSNSLGQPGDMGTGTLTLEQPICLEDLDGSGDVGFSDLVSILSAWGPCP